MSYTPPAGAGVNFAISSSPYTPPRGDQVFIGIDAQPNGLFPQGINSQGFGIADVSYRDRTVAPVAFSANVFPNPTIKNYLTFTTGVGNIDKLLFGTTRIENKNRVLLQAGGSDASAFGTTKIENKNKQYTLTGFATAAYGTPRLSRNPQVASMNDANPLANPEYRGQSFMAFGTAKAYKNKLEASGASTQAFGTTLITLRIRFLLHAGTDTMALGTPSARRNQLYPIGFDTALVSGGHAIADPNRAVLRAGNIPPGKDVNDAFAVQVPSPTVVNTKIPVGCGDQLALGKPQVWPVRLAPGGIPWAGAGFMGTPKVYSNNLLERGWDSQLLGKPNIGRSPQVAEARGWYSQRFGFNDFTLTLGGSYPGVFHTNNITVPPAQTDGQYGTPTIAHA